MHTNTPPPPHTHTHTHTTELLTRQILNHECVPLQAVLDFRRQIGNMETMVFEQCNELFGTGWEVSGDCSWKQKQAELRGALNVSGRYFTYKEQLKVRPNAHLSGARIKLAEFI